MSNSEAASNSIRVMHVITRLNVGGAALHAAECGKLRGHGFDPLLVYGSTGTAEGSLEEAITGGDLRTWKIPELGRRIRPWKDLQAFCRLIALVFREKPAILHTHTAKAGVLGRLAAWLYNLTRPAASRCTVVHTFHGHLFQGYFNPAATSAVRAVERVMARLSDRILVLSESQKVEICGLYRIASPEKTEVIGLSPDLEKFLDVPPGRRQVAGWPFAAGHIVFGYVGRFAPIKDLCTLVRAFHSVSSVVPQARLVLVGDGELRSGLDETVRNCGIEKQVVFAGWRRDLPDVYAGIDVFVLSSINEGTPMSLVEAMAAARPVIATRVGGIPDLIPDGAGILVPPQDVQTLAGALESLARDPDLRIRIGSEARRSIRLRFGNTRLEDEIGACYRRLLREKRGKAEAASHRLGRRNGMHR